MKKYLYLLMAFATLAVFSCKEPEPEPVPEPEDEAYADFIFQYEVNLPADASSYSSVPLDLASVKGVDSKGEKYDVWECFGLSSQSELIAALGTLSGDAQSGQTVDFIGFDVSTEYVVENPSTTLAFGHWHMANGDICNWGDNAYVFAEGYFIENENLVMSIGQFPGRLKEGETYKIIEGMQDDEVSVAFEITINVKPQTEWAVYNITNVGGEDVQYQFPVEDIAKLLGVSDLAKAVIDGTVVLKPRNADGSYYGKYSQVDEADAKGVFFNLEGNCCDWQNNAGAADEYYGHFYSTIYFWNEEGKDYIEFYLTPYAATEDDLGYYEFSWDLVNGDKVATIVFCTDLQSSKPYASYSVYGYNYTVKMVPNNDYKNIVIPMPETLAADLGVEAISAEALEAGTIRVVGLNADESEYTEKEKTAGGIRGWWYDVDGNIREWGEGCYAFAESDDLLNYRIGLYPGLEVGQTATLRFKYVAGDKSQIIQVWVTTVSEIEE